MTNGDFLIVTSQPASQPATLSLQETYRNHWHYWLYGFTPITRSSHRIRLKLSMPRFRYQMGLKGFVFMSSHEEM